MKHTLLFALSLLAFPSVSSASASCSNQLALVVPQKGDARLYALTTLKSKPGLARYDKKRSMVASVTLPGPANTLCATQNHVVVALRGGGIVLYTANLTLPKSVKSLPMLALMCTPTRLYAGGKTIKVRTYALPSLKEERPAGENASWTSLLLPHPKGGIIALSWAHRAWWFKPGSPKIPFRFLSSPIHAALTDEGDQLVVITDRDKVRFFSLTGKKLNWAKTARARCVASSGNTVLVGLSSGYAQRFVLRGSRFKKSAPIELLHKSPIEHMVPLWDGWWAISSRGTVHFKKPAL